MPSRALRLRPVHSEKREISWSNLLQDASTVVGVNIIRGKEPPDANLDDEIITGSTVKFVYFEFHFSNQDGSAPAVIHWQVVKRPFGTLVSAPNSYNDNDKRFVLKRGMEMLPADMSTVFKRIVVVKLPPRIGRIGQDDNLQFQYISSSGALINACGIAIYKFFS